MCPNSEQYEQVCRERFDRLSGQMTDLIDAIVGTVSNGKPGVLERIRILEAQADSRAKIKASVLGAIAAGGVGLAFAIIKGFAT